MILLRTAESVVTRMFRTLAQRGEEIALATPEARDPASAGTTNQDA
jgi:hypothetical protein